MTQNNNHSLPIAQLCAEFVSLNSVSPDRRDTIYELAHKLLESLAADSTAYHRVLQLDPGVIRGEEDDCASRALFNFLKAHIFWPNTPSIWQKVFERHHTLSRLNSIDDLLLMGEVCSEVPAQRFYINQADAELFLAEHLSKWHSKLVCEQSNAINVAPEYFHNLLEACLHAYSASQQLAAELPQLAEWDLGFFQELGRQAHDLMQNTKSTYDSPTVAHYLLQAMCEQMQASPHAEACVYLLAPFVDDICAQPHRFCDSLWLPIFAALAAQPSQTLDMIKQLSEAGYWHPTWGAPLATALVQALLDRQSLTAWAQWLHRLPAQIQQEVLATVNTPALLADFCSSAAALEALMLVLEATQPTSHICKEIISYIIDKLDPIALGAQLQARWDDTVDHVLLLAFWQQAALQRPQNTLVALADLPTTSQVQSIRTLAQAALLQSPAAMLNAYSAHSKSIQLPLIITASLDELVHSLHHGARNELRAFFQAVHTLEQSDKTILLNQLANAPEYDYLRLLISEALTHGDAWLCVATELQVLYEAVSLEVEGHKHLYESFRAQLGCLLEQQDWAGLQELRTDNQQWVVGLLLEMLHDHDFSSGVPRECIQLLRKLGCPEARLPQAPARPVQHSPKNKLRAVQPNPKAVMNERLFILSKVQSLSDLMQMGERCARIANKTFYIHQADAETYLKTLLHKWHTKVESDSAGDSNNDFNAIFDTCWHAYQASQVLAAELSDELAWQVTIFKTLGKKALDLIQKQAGSTSASKAEPQSAMVHVLDCLGLQLQNPQGTEACAQFLLPWATALCAKSACVMTADAESLWLQIAHLLAPQPDADNSTLQLVQLLAQAGYWSADWSEPVAQRLLAALSEQTALTAVAPWLKHVSEQHLRDIFARLFVLAQAEPQPIQIFTQLLTDMDALQQRYDICCSNPESIGQMMQMPEAHEILTLFLSKLTAQSISMSEIISYITKNLDHKPVEWAIRLLRDSSRWEHILQPVQWQHAATQYPMNTLRVFSAIVSDSAAEIPATFGSTVAHSLSLAAKNALFRDMLTEIATELFCGEARYAALVTEVGRFWSSHQYSDKLARLQASWFAQAEPNLKRVLEILSHNPCAILALYREQPGFQELEAIASASIEALARCLHAGDVDVLYDFIAAANGLEEADKNFILQNLTYETSRECCERICAMFASDARIGTAEAIGVLATLGQAAFYAEISQHLTKAIERRDWTSLEQGILRADKPLWLLKQLADELGRNDRSSDDNLDCLRMLSNLGCRAELITRSMWGIPELLLAHLLQSDDADQHVDIIARLQTMLSSELQDRHDILREMWISIIHHCSTQEKYNAAALKQFFGLPEAVHLLSPACWKQLSCDRPAVLFTTVQVLYSVLEDVDSLSSDFINLMYDMLGHVTAQLVIGNDKSWKAFFSKADDWTQPFFTELTEALHDQLLDCSLNNKMADKVYRRLSLLRDPDYAVSCIANNQAQLFKCLKLALTPTGVCDTPNVSTVINILLYDATWLEPLQEAEFQTLRSNMPAGLQHLANTLPSQDFKDCDGTMLFTKVLLEQLNQLCAQVDLRKSRSALEQASSKCTAFILFQGIKHSQEIRRGLLQLPATDPLWETLSAHSLSLGCCLSTPLKQDADSLKLRLPEAVVKSSTELQQEEHATHGLCTQLCRCLSIMDYHRDWSLQMILQRIWTVRLDDHCQHSRITPGGMQLLIKIISEHFERALIDSHCLVNGSDIYAKDIMTLFVSRAAQNQLPPLLMQGFQDYTLKVINHVERLLLSPLKQHENIQQLERIRLWLSTTMLTPLAYFQELCRKLGELSDDLGKIIRHYGNQPANEVQELLDSALQHQADCKTIVRNMLQSPADRASCSHATEPQHNVLGHMLQSLNDLSSLFTVSKHPEKSLDQTFHVLQHCAQIISEPQKWQDTYGSQDLLNLVLTNFNLLKLSVEHSGAAGSSLQDSQLYAKSIETFEKVLEMALMVTPLLYLHLYQQQLKEGTAVLISIASTLGINPMTHSGLKLLGGLGVDYSGVKTLAQAKAQDRGEFSAAVLKGTSNPTILTAFIRGLVLAEELLQEALPSTLSTAAIAAWLQAEALTSVVDDIHPFTHIFSENIKVRVRWQVIALGVAFLKNIRNPAELVQQPLVILLIDWLLSDMLSSALPHHQQPKAEMLDVLKPLFLLRLRALNEIPWTGLPHIKPDELDRFCQPLQ